MLLFGKRRSFSQQGEDLAAKYLRRHGYQILDRNVHLGRFEIDIIARDGDTIAFVEVKTRKSDAYAAPEENVTPEKRRHIRHAAHLYIAQPDAPDTYYRYDVVSVVMPEKGRAVVTLFKNAFEDE
jgi:putative endonuclease